MAYSIRIPPFTVQVHRPGSLKKREHAMSNIHLFTSKNGSKVLHSVVFCAVLFGFVWFFTVIALYNSE